MGVPIRLVILCEGLPPPVTGIPAVADVSASEVEVGASVAVILVVLVASTVAGGALVLVLGTLVVSSAPQAANSKEARTTIVKIKLAFFMRTKFLSILSAGKNCPPAKDITYRNEPRMRVEQRKRGCSLH
jgi:hypothetical protein